MLGEGQFAQQHGQINSFGQGPRAGVMDEMFFPRSQPLLVLRVCWWQWPVTGSPRGGMGTATRAQGLSSAAQPRDTELVQAGEVATGSHCPPGAAAARGTSRGPNTPLAAGARTH